MHSASNRCTSTPQNPLSSPLSPRSNKSSPNLDASKQARSQTTIAETPATTVESTATSSPTSSVFVGIQPGPITPPPLPARTYRNLTSSNSSTPLSSSQDVLQKPTLPQRTYKLNVNSQGTSLSVSPAKAADTKQDELSQFIVVESSNNNSTPEAGANEPNYDKLFAINKIDVKCESKRDQIANELLKTEQNYVRYLKILIYVWMKPMEEAAKKGTISISVDNVHRIFTGIEDILQVNTLLLEQLEEKMKNWGPKQTLGDVLLKLTPFLKMYKQYAISQQNAVKMLNENQSVLAEFLAQCQQKPVCGKLDLNSFLIMPIQRIPRYVLLLEDLLKHTEENHPDFNSLSQTLITMKTVANDINESIKEHQNYLKILEIQSKFMNCPPLVEPHRKYIRDGILIKICRKERKRRWFVLFNDILIYGVPLAFPADRYMLSQKVELVNTRFEDIPDDPSKQITNAFKISSNSKSFIVLAISQAEKFDWLVDLTTRSSQAKKRRETMLVGTPLFSHDSSSPLSGETATNLSGEGWVAPVWVPNEEQPNCQLCNTPFSLLIRRHHCRQCGRLVCGDCSSHRKVIESLGKTPVRVCDNCVNREPTTE
jgi:hypothetical protein